MSSAFSGGVHSNIVVTVSQMLQCSYISTVLLNIIRQIILKAQMLVMMKTTNFVILDKSFKKCRKTEAFRFKVSSLDLPSSPVS